MNNNIDPLSSPNANKRHWLAQIFLTPNEPRLRLVWRILFLFVLAMVLSIPPLVLSLLLSNVNSVSPELSPMLVYILPSGIAFLIAILITRRYIDRRSIISLGFKIDRSATYDLLAGIGIGGLLMTSIFIIEYAEGWLKFEGFTSFTASSMVELLVWGVGFIVVGIYEELLFRGYLFQNIEEGLNTLWALAITCVFFSFAHLSNPNYHWGSVLGLLFSSLFLTYAYLRTRQLWLSIGLHIGWNFFQGPVFGFPVSGLQTFTIIHQQVNGPALITGGDFGPEGGLVLLIGLVLGTLLIYYSRKPGKEPLNDG